ncbi:MAG TPA: LysM peptidoglycan-binding domain-containing protein [Stellaceae bacterium]|nr:LysM peptidoglycan-binding domain-containing protein [Stellaceae bacterium]
MTRTAAHKVKAGDTLWSIAKRHYGAGHVWPSIYIYNNSPAVKRQRGNRGIVNPNLIHPGEVVYLPPIGSHLVNDPAIRRQVTEQMSSAKPGSTHPGSGHVPAATGTSHLGKPSPAPVMPSFPRPMGPTSPNIGNAPSTAPGRVANSNGPAGHTIPHPVASQPHTTPHVDNPAEHLMVKGFAYAYRLDDLPLVTQHYPGFTVTIKMQGVIAIQADDKTALVTYSQKDVQLQARKEADSVYGQLLSDQKVTWDRAKNAVNFECVLTTRANAHAVSTAISAAVSNGKPVIRSIITFPKMSGMLAKHTWGTAEFKVVLEISPDPETRGPAPAPVTAPAPAPSHFHMPEVHVSPQAQKVIGTVAVIAVAAVVVWFAWPVIAAYGAGAAATAGVAATAAGITVWQGENGHIQSRNNGPPQT